MPPLNDSDAVYSEDRVLPQHQAALTILQARLSDPSPDSVRWLDIACGRGQILASLQANLSAKARKKLQYLGFDVSSTFVTQTKQLAESLDLACVETKVGDLADLAKLIPEAPPYDFITFTNSAHEVAPPQLAAVLVDATLRLSATGTLFVYDMETIAPHELGAIPWRRDEFKAIIATMLQALNCGDYEPELGSWPHRTTQGWNAQIQRTYMGDHDLTGRRDDAIACTAERLVQVMKLKLKSCKATLEKLTQYGCETEAERSEQTHLLYEFWSLARALEVVS